MIEGDFIGTDDTGAKALANGGDGVDIIGGATSNIVGGTTTGTLDVISGNANEGVVFTDTGTKGNYAEGTTSVPTTRVPKPSPTAMAW